MSTAGANEPPEILYGNDGDTVFIRRDLAATDTAARAYALSEGTNLASFEADDVEMLPVPEHFVVDEDWWVVRPGTPNAVAYWKFQV